MIGPRKLKEIRADVAEEFANEGLDMNQWLAERIQHLKDKKRPVASELETLNILRAAIKTKAMRRAARSEEHTSELQSH